MRRTARTVAAMTLGDFTEALASGEAVPGGGAAAAVAGSLASSLISMVVRLSLGRERYAPYVPLHEEALAAAEVARDSFLVLADADATAYAGYRSARALPHATPAQELTRSQAIADAARGATTVPLDVIASCHEQVELIERLVGRSNRYGASDLQTAALLLESAARASSGNVRANLGSIGDEGYERAVLAEMDQRLQRIQGLVERIRERIAEAVNRAPEGT
jgi:formiminotetrahydrofolate cyclodeaminase